MERLTQRQGNDLVYVGRYTKMPGLDRASGMRVAAVRDVMERLAQYEETGLTPEQVENLLAKKS